MKHGQKQPDKLTLPQWDGGDIATAKALLLTSIAFGGCALAIPEGFVALIYVAGVLLLLALLKFLPYHAIVIDARRSRVLIRKRVFLTLRQTIDSYSLGDFDRAVLAWDREPFRGWRFDPGISHAHNAEHAMLRLFSYVEDASVPGVAVLSVRLTDPSGKSSVELARLRADKYLQARRLTEQLVRTTGLAYYDLSAGEPVVRTADQIDSPLGELLASGAIELTSVTRPRHTTISHEASKGTLRFTRRTAKLRLGTLIAMVTSSCLVLGYGIWVVRQPQLWDPSSLRLRDALHLPLLGACIIHIGCCVRWLLLLSFARESLRMSQDSLQSHVRRVFRGRATAIHLLELEDLSVCPASDSTGVLIARSDDTEMYFGRGLPLCELAWIRSEVLHSLQASELFPRIARVPTDESLADEPVEACLA